MNGSIRFGAALMVCGVLSCAGAPPAAEAPRVAARKLAPGEETQLPPRVVIAQEPEPPPPAPPRVETCPALSEESTATLAELPKDAVEEAPPQLQLPKDARPTHQAISLTIDPLKPRFSGTAAIALQLDRPRSVVWMHGLGLHVTEAHLDVQGARLAAEYAQVNDAGLVRVRFPCLVSGRGLLTISYDAAFDEKLQGLYLAREAGETYATTQFEAIDARRALPGFDEPAFKIPWDVELVVPEKDVAISNGAIGSEEPAENGMRRIEFNTTPPLPTYLLAFCVGPFDVVSPPPLPPNEVRDRPLAIRGVVPKGRAAELAFAMEATAQLLPRLERWFGIAYPYEKLDQIAVPDFTYGAMENAGAIIYREEELLFTPGVSSEAGMRGIAVTAAHEMAHQWFGDFVTLRWWTDAWLNESFASWMETKMVEDWRPDLRTAESAQRELQRAMAQDATRTARPIRQPVTEESQIWNQFDVLTYNKGAALLSMVESWVGKETFRKGIQDYLRAHANGSGSSDDLIQALTVAASTSREVAGPLRSYLEQGGIPLVHVKISCGAKVRLYLSQERDLPAGAKKLEAKEAKGAEEASGAAGRKPLWQIPFCARASIRGENRSACTMLTEETGELELPGTRCPDWVMPDAGGIGYYRYALEPDALAALARMRGLLTPAERASLASNLVSAYVQSAAPANDVLRTLSAFARDREPLAASSSMEVLRDAWNEMLPPRWRPQIEAYSRALYAPVAERLTWTEAAGEGPSAQEERATVLRFLADTGRDPQVRAEGARLGQAYANLDGETFDARAASPELAGLALELFAQEAGPEARRKLIARLTTSSDAVVRRRILAALSANRDPAVTPELLALTFDPQLRKNERSRLLALQLMHPETRAPAMSWLVARWDALTQQIPPENMAGFVRLIAQLPCDRASLESAEKFLTPRAAKIPSAKLELGQGLEAAQLCIARREAQGKSLEAFFSSPPKLHAN